MSQWTSSTKHKPRVSWKNCSGRSMDPSRIDSSGGKRTLTRIPPNRDIMSAETWWNDSEYDAEYELEEASGRYTMLSRVPRIQTTIRILHSHICHVSQRYGDHEVHDESKNAKSHSKGRGCTYQHSGQCNIDTAGQGSPLDLVRDFEGLPSTNTFGWKR